MFLCYDVESTGFLDKVDLSLHCICAINEMHSLLIFVAEENIEHIKKLYPKALVQEFSRFPDVATNYTSIICHNQIRYDLPVLQRLLGMPWSCYPMHINNSEMEIIDTLLESRWLNPDRQLPKNCPERLAAESSKGKSKVITPHGLEAWGMRVANLKPKIELWEGLPIEDYVHRCIEDVKINIKTFYALTEEMAVMWGLPDDTPWRDVRKAAEFVIGYERLFLYDIYLQAKHGIKFDVDLAHKLVEQLDILMAQMDEEWKDKMPLIDIPKSRLKTDYKFPAKAFTKGGQPSSTLLKFLDKHDATCDFNTKELKVGGQVFTPPWPEYIKVLEPMTFNSRGIPQWLVDNLGWEPLNWNYKIDPATGRKMRDEHKQLIPTSPKIKDPATGSICPNLMDLDAPFAQAVVRYGTLSHRRKTILGKEGKDGEESTTGYLNNPRLAIDGRLSADMITSGAVTRRVTHKVVANVPKAEDGVLFGKELRSLFYVDSEEYYMIGYDAQGLEARLEAAEAFVYDKGVFMDLVLNHDIHTIRAKRFNISRGKAKGVGYGLSYGAQAAKLASMLNCSVAEAKVFLEQWWDENWATKKAIDKLTIEWEKSGKKWITSVDGSKLWVRAPHSILNTRLQNAGTTVMKIAACLMHKWTKDYRDQGLVNKLLDYHDEAAYEVKKSLVKWKQVHSEEEAKLLIPEGWSKVTKVNNKLYVANCIVGQLGVKSIIKAGQILKIPVPMDSVYAVGKTWGEIH